jgi:hypothetical protein
MSVMIDDHLNFRKRRVRANPNAGLIEAEYGDHTDADIVSVNGRDEDPAICCQMSDPKRLISGTYVRSTFEQFRPHLDSPHPFRAVSVRISNQTYERV